MALLNLARVGMAVLAKTAGASSKCMKMCDDDCRAPGTIAYWAYDCDEDASDDVREKCYSVRPGGGVCAYDL